MLEYFSSKIKNTSNNKMKEFYNNQNFLRNMDEMYECLEDSVKKVIRKTFKKMFLQKFFVSVEI